MADINQLSVAKFISHYFCVYVAIACESECEQWSQTTVNTKNVDCDVFQGLNDVKWCRKQDLNSGRSLEDRAFDQSMLQQKL